MDAVGLHAHLKGSMCQLSEQIINSSCTGNDVLDWRVTLERIDVLWSEFHLPIWVTEFDWNGDLSADFGDHTQHAEILENLHRLMFSHEVLYELFRNKLF